MNIFSDVIVLSLVTANLSKKRFGVETERYILSSYQEKKISKMACQGISAWLNTHGFFEWCNVKHILMHIRNSDNTSFFWSTKINHMLWVIGCEKTRTKNISFLSSSVSQTLSPSVMRARNFKVTSDSVRMLTRNNFQGGFRIKKESNKAGFLMPCWQFALIHIGNCSINTLCSNIYKMFDLKSVSSAWSTQKAMIK